MYLQSKSWETLVALTTKIADLGWFTPPPKKSMLRLEPACAWFTAGIAQVSQESKVLSALQRSVLRAACKRWIEVHFYLPVAGHMPGESNKHINMMRFFVTYVWAYYSHHQRPKVPAFTNVGRFIFTYIWSKQHALFR